jgi:hypothetical protein
MCDVSCRLRGETEPSSQLDNGSTTSHYLSGPHSPGSENSHQRRPLIGPPPGVGPVVMLAAHPLPPGGAQPIPTGGLQYETYIKSQLLSNLYLQQYMTNNLANIGHLGVVGGADHLLSFTAAAAAQSAVLQPVPSVTLTAVQSRSKPRRLAAAVVTESCGPGPLDLSSSRPEVPAVAATAAASTSSAASQPVVITKISLAPAPPPAHVRAGENGSVPPSAEAGLNLSSALHIKAAAPPAEPAADVSTKAENEECEREDDSPPPPSATEASEEPPAASANPNACPICGQSFTGQDRYVQADRQTTTLTDSKVTVWQSS